MKIGRAFTVFRSLFLFFICFSIRASQEEGFPYENTTAIAEYDTSSPILPIGWLYDDSGIYIVVPCEKIEILIVQAMNTYFFTKDIMEKMYEEDQKKFKILFCKTAPLQEIIQFQNWKPFWKEMALRVYKRYLHVLKEEEENEKHKNISSITPDSPFYFAYAWKKKYAKKEISP